MSSQTHSAASGSANPLAASVAAAPALATGTMVLPIVLAVAFAHLLNDLTQAVLPAIYPLLKANFDLSFAQIGQIALLFQITGAILQPAVGLYTDKHPLPYLLPAGMAATLVGIGLLSVSSSYTMLLVSACLIGMGSATFHPEASRVARMASGGKFGTAQSTFQVGGNTGTAIGPLVAAMFIVPLGQAAVSGVMLIVALAIVVLLRVTRWVRQQAALAPKVTAVLPPLNKARVVRVLAVIGVLLFAKFAYTASLTNYFTFYLMGKFGLPVAQAQMYLFVFLASVAAGTFIGGPVGDRIGRKAVIWVSFIGSAPFALMLPHANLFWTGVLVVVIGLVMSSAFAALVVYAQETMPGRVGMVSGLMFGLMFGFGGIAAAGLGQLADVHGIEWVYGVCAFLPLLGVAAALLPKLKPQGR